MGWQSAITAVFAFLLFVGERWASNQPAREKEAADAKKQQGRADIASGNADAISIRIDGVLAGTPNSIAGIQSAEDVERRLSQL